MKEELQGKLVEILTSIQAAAGQASGFALEQLPDIAQSYVAYGRVMNSVVIGAFAMAVLLALFVTLRFGYFNRSAVHQESSVFHAKGDWLEGRVFVSIMGTVLSGVLIVAAIVNLSGFLLVWFAPKVWLLKEIASLLK